ncbi:hypothetical protein G6011_03533 [Alternaria panax]|uniref:Uncharacterized protein n=1 Tax=Alternaria panax TaxID=48097 RepID=A0AAD4IFI1_9PLEO|nr:hypothetical protein G6011_03533 [Alternaria panax]
MDTASDHTPPGPRVSPGSLYRALTTPVEDNTEMKKPETEVRPNEPLTQGSENSADRKCSANEKENLKGKNVQVAANDNGKPSSAEESSTGEKEQLMVKLKYKAQTIIISPLDHRESSKGTSSTSNSGAKSCEISNPSFENSVVKQETGDHRDSSPQNSKRVDPQIKIEKRGHDEASIPKPLNEPTQKLSRVNIIKDEPSHDVHQQIDQSGQGLARDDMDADAHLGVDVMHVPVNGDVSSKPPDAVGAQTAATELEKVQEAVVQDEHRANDSDDEYKQRKSASPEVGRGTSTGLDDDYYMSDEIDLNEWASSVTNGPQEDQRHRTVNHHFNSSGFMNDVVSVPQEDQVEQPPSNFNNGQSGFGVQDAWSQLHPDFSDPVHLTSKSSSPHYWNSPVPTPVVTSNSITQHQIPPPRHVSRQPLDPCSQPNLDPGFGREQPIQAQIEDQRKQLINLRNLNGEHSQPFQQSPYDFGYPQSLSSAPPTFLTEPLTYQRAPQFSNQQLPTGLKSIGVQQPTFPTLSYAQVQPNMSYSFNPASLYKRSTKTLASSSSNSWIPGPYVLQGPQKMREKVSDGNDCVDEYVASDDDEPLRSRVKRHPSVTSSRDSVIGNSTLPMASNGIARHSRQDDDSDVEFVASTAKPKPTVPKAIQNPMPMSRPVPQLGTSSPPAKNTPSYPETAGEIDWTLPQYEVQCQPLAKGEDIPSAKVSLPGLVHEELFLSPDHANQEVHLLMNIFIPNQRALPDPDPEPAIALLNFHTIAVMVIEAYVQYEIGDEFGTGRGHLHTQHDRGDTEYERMRDAVDADTNEIFFAVVDRYRAGLESKKKPLQLIRGMQEFCDLALDLIFYIKDHGLLRPELEVRAARVDKGVKRGPRGETRAEEAKGKGTKRGTTAKPNEVQPRKRAKTAAVAEVKKKRAKSKIPALTVVRK